MDRRVRRTRTALIEAIVDITGESGWSAVSVSAVAARADVGRTTFYEHFDDREHLLRAAIDQQVITFQVGSGSTIDAEALARHVLEGAPAMAHFVAIPLFRTAVADALVEALRPSTSEAAARFIAGGLLAIADQVASGSEQPSPAEVTQLISQALAVSI